MNLQPHEDTDDTLIDLDTGRLYPSKYAPGLGNWATDEAWTILDTLKKDALSLEARCFIAGQIAGALMRAKEK